MDTKKDKAISRENRAAKERAKDVGEAARIADHAIEGEAGEWIAEALPVGYVMECLVRHEKEGTAPEWTDGPNQTAARMVLQRAFLRQAGGDGRAVHLRTLAAITAGKFAPEIETEDANAIALCAALAKVPESRNSRRSMLAKLVESLPAEVKPETRKDYAIFPVLARIEAGEVHPDLLRGLRFLGNAAPTDAPPELPIWGKPPDDKLSPLLEFIDASGLPIRSQGKGAPVGVRFAVRALLAFPHNERWRRRARLALRLGDLTGALFPNYRRGRDWPKLRAAILQADHAAIRLEATKAWGFRFLVMERLPTLYEGAPDDVVSFEIRLPPGTADGPIIDLEAIDALGVQSSPRYFAYLGAHSVNWLPGRTRVPVAKGRGGKWVKSGWRHDAALYPVLTYADLRRIAYGSQDQKHRTRKDIQDAFTDLPGLVLLRDQQDRQTGVTGFRLVPEHVFSTTSKGGTRHD